MAGGGNADGGRKTARSGSERRQRENHDNDVRLRMMEKDGDRLLRALSNGKMVGVLSGMEIMYVFVFMDQYQCFIHKFDAEEGRRRGFPMDERNTAMIKNLASAADQLFEITPKPDMHPLGVMQAAEKGIIAYLDMTGQLPAEDVDFMDWQQPPEGAQET